MRQNAARQYATFSKIKNTIIIYATLECAHPKQDDIEFSNILPHLYAA
jgi:hypothetical protein